MDYPLLVSSNLPYRSRAVRAMVLLHEEHLRRFVQTWRQALAARVNLSPTRDPNYASLGALGRHVLSAAGGYLVWMCEVLRLPDPRSPACPGCDYHSPRCGWVYGARSRALEGRGAP
jgi:hypothetical protein